MLLHIHALNLIELNQRWSEGKYKKPIVRKQIIALHFTFIVLMSLSKIGHKRFLVLS